MKYELGSPLEVSLLTVGNQEKTQAFVEKISRNANWNLLSASSNQEANSLIQKNPVHVVLIEDSADCDWRDILRDLNRLDNPPQLVVTSRLADEYLWAEVLNMGGYDVLAQPLRSEELERVVDAANRQYLGKSNPRLAAMTA